MRGILATFFCLSLVRLRKMATKHYGRSIGVYFIIITLCQFHLLFYSSRPLPNVFATILTTYGFSLWIEEVFLFFIIFRNINMEYFVLLLLILYLDVIY